MERIYPIFVPPPQIREGIISHNEVIDWCYNHLLDSSSNALILKQEDVYLLQHNSKVLDIVNEENDSSIAEGESDWIFSEEVKVIVLNRWENYYKTLPAGRVKEILVKLIALMRRAIEIDGNVYFQF